MRKCWSFKASRLFRELRQALSLDRIQAALVFGKDSRCTLLEEQLSTFWHKGQYWGTIRSQFDSGHGAGKRIRNEKTEIIERAMRSLMADLQRGTENRRGFLH
jgi:hypothetical protein